MKRFFGLMPVESISIEEIFIDDCGLKVIIQAGSEGYSILYADYSREYEDVVDTPENNFDKAYRIVTKRLGRLRKYIQNKEVTI